MVIIGQVSGRQSFERKFEIPFPVDQLFRSKYYLDHKEKAWVVSYERNYAFVQYYYGMVPFWSKKEVLHYESPVEGSLDPNAERTKKRIIVHPSYRRPIRENRCLIPADYFIILNTLEEPFLVFSSLTSTFALAGIYDNWKENYHQKDFYQGFSLLTVAAPEDFREHGIDRLPLIIPERRYKRWLNPDVALAEITALMESTSEDNINAYPVNKKVFLQKMNSKELCRPIGDLIRPLPQDPGKVVAFLRSFRFRRGATHDHTAQDSRIWRSEG